LVKEDFIPRIVQFNTETITPEITEKMKPFVNNPDWEYDKVFRASNACGPLVKWAKAQLSYAKMLNKVEPLNNELSRLEKDASLKANAGEEVNNKIQELEERIQKLKEEYAQLIAEAENIKQNLAAVQKKVDRSTQLLSSLRVECDRWQTSREGFSQQNATLVGDVILSAAFLSYSGYYDQYLRDKLFQKWMAVLQAADVVFRHELARIEYLSTADERQQWYTNGMPKDELCTENAIMLHNFNRFPLIIDPNGQSIDYICKEFSSNNRDQKITVQKTSFNDNSFRKTLESALRFGTTLLVQDVESYDPLLNPVLNREVKRASGRVLITIGDQDIDLSPAFRIFLFTRDSSVEFPSDVCSRVTFVNFTITKTSLEMQCLNQVLHSERPDIEEKRNNLLKLQGEFAVRLRQLEKALLNALNDSKGKILDDDSVIATLEKLKNEAKEVQKKSSETDEVIKEVDRVSHEYNKLATACSYIYMMLHQLDEIHLLYNYSLDFLLDIFTNALKSPKLSGVKDHHTRLSIILQDLFSLTYSRVSHGMMHVDKILLALLLLRIYLRCTSSNKFEEEFDYLLLYSSKLQLKSLTSLNSKQIHIPPLNEQQISSLLSLSKLPAFKDCIEKFKTTVSTEDLIEWLRSDQPENSVPEIWSTKELGNPIARALNEFIVIYTLRPDRLLASAHLLIVATFGNEFMLQDKVLNLREVIEHEIKSKVPILLCSAVGYDVSGRVEDLAVEMNNKDMVSIAIGSSEGFDQADKAIDSSSRNGRWMLLKNVHLAPDWLTHLEKKLHNLKPHNNFRLFLTAEINSKLPVSIIQASRVLVFEPSTGLKANLLRSLSSISPQKIAKNPAERSRLYFLLCWFHAIVQERLRYQPLGWANSYEFSDADLRVACDTLDQSVDSIAQGRSNVKPSKLPWLALRSLLSQCIYGGKIDNRFDQNLLETFLNKLFTQSLFDSNFVLIDDIDGSSTPLIVPDETSTKDSLINWVHQIKAAQMPSWIGLPNNAEKVLLTERGQELLRKLLKMSDDELAYEEIDSSLQNKVAPSWMVILKDHCQSWLAELPKEICKLRRTKENVKDPIFRFFEREINLGSRLLNEIRRDLKELLDICDGKHKQNNHTRELIAALVKSKQVPTSWKQYTTPKDVIAHEWMNDLKERVNQLDRLSRSDNLKAESVWLGGMFFPEAYITATRQFVAQTNGWSLEQLNMHVRSVGNSGKGVDQGPTNFSLTGLRAVGIICESPNQIKLTDSIHSEVNKLQFVWTLEKQKEDEVVSVPVYLYSNRSQFLFELYFVPHNFDKSLLSQRGVALLTNSSL
jgi:dynein heavy chain 1